jgi:hypothetical protein
MCLGKGISDHNPVLVESGEGGRTRSKRFMFEKWWGERGEFKEIVAKALKTERIEHNPISCWQDKIRRFRKISKGWSANVVSKMNRHKQTLIVEYECIDLEAKSRVLVEVEKRRLKSLLRKLDNLGYRRYQNKAEV